MKNTYVITGAGQGSGHFFAKTVATLGANIALLSRTQSDLDSLKTELLQINSTIKISTHTVDLSDPHQTKIAFDSVKLIHGASIKAVICFAGSWINSKTLDTLEAGRIEGKFFLYL